MLSISSLKRGGSTAEETPVALVSDRSIIGDGGCSGMGKWGKWRKRLKSVCLTTFVRHVIIVTREAESALSEEGVH